MDDNEVDALKARLAEVEGQRAELASKLSHLVDSLKHAEARTLDAEARVAVLEKALESIRQYGSDTLSGRADGGSDDRQWQREAVREMTRRARTALAEQKEMGK